MFLDVDETIKAVREEGVYLVRSFLGEEDLIVLKSLAERELEKNPVSGYSFGRAARLTSPPQDIKNFFLKREFQDVVKGLGASTALDGVFITHDHKNDADLARNGYLHFDRLHFLKFFFYLTDVDEDCGPLTCCPGSHIEMKQLREKAIKESSGYSNIKNRIDVDYPQLSDKFERVPILAPAGSLIVFDTSVLHMGGVTKNGKERMVIRGHHKW